MRPTVRPGRQALKLALAAAVLAVCAAVAVPLPVAAFSGFGSMTASERYGDQMTFTVELPGGAPERLEILLQFGPDPDSTFVAPVAAGGTSATFTWDTSTDYVTPNTAVTYRWRATSGSTVTVSPARTLLYADNRPGLDWRSVRIGQATVHWYGDHEGQARRFGDLTSGAVTRAEATLGHALDGPVDIFVYVSQSDFFGALGSGAREWTGAATFPNIRTVFMWLGAAPQGSDYFDRALVHEVTHVVFADATSNLYHDPARWLNEGFSVWSEQQNADDAARTVRSEVSAGLFSFEAITGDFPIGARGSSLSYAEGATMVDRIIATYGRGAMAGIAAAYRSGATDAEALKAGTGVSADQLYADYFRAFGAREPQPVAAATIGPSIVRVGTNGATGSEAPVASSGPTASADGSPAEATATAVLGWISALVLVVVIGGGFILWRRQQARTDG